MQYGKMPTCTIADYLRAKREHPLAIVFLRSGDFYEAFGSDAVTASRELDLVILTRETGPGQAVQMAGFPHHTAETYAQRLRERGYHYVVLGDLEPDKDNDNVDFVLKHDPETPDWFGPHPPDITARVMPKPSSITISFFDDDAFLGANVYIEYRGGEVVARVWTEDDWDECATEAIVIRDPTTAVEEVRKRKEQDHE